MTSMLIAFVLTIWALPAPGETAVVSTNMADFLTMQNGVYDNLAQYQTDNKTFDYIQMRTFPVAAPGFPDRHMIFVEYAFNGVVFNLYFCEATEDSRGVIHAAVYNFTEPSLYKPGEYKLEDLVKLKPTDLQTPSSCEAEFEPYGPYYYGTWPTCRHYVNGKPSFYSSIVSCDHNTIIVPVVATEKSAPLPYHLVLKGDKFQVPDLPSGFVDPCRSRKSE